MKLSFLALAVSAALLASCAARLPGVAGSAPAAGTEAAKAAPPAMSTASAAAPAPAPAPAPAAKPMSVATGSGASASLLPLSSKVNGTVRFAQKGDKVNVAGEIFGLTPGQHGIHIHEVGDCSAADGASAKGHFNPANKAHGAHMGERHGGDLGNITADASGMANLNVDVDGITISTGPNGILTRSVIVHADPDDLKTQPAGNSGKRIACGIIVQK
ncbi:MAG: superoxide dismutase family protein [Burkholderiales bacterium]